LWKTVNDSFSLLGLLFLCQKEKKAGDLACENWEKSIVENNPQRNTGE